MNILIVEDESIVAKDIELCLKKLGYNVVDMVSSGLAAINSAEEYKPDLILMDIMLKGDMSGIEAAGKIRETLKIPVIFLTAYTDEKTINKAKHTEPYGYIIKPFKEIDIQTSIEIALYKHGRENEVRKERDFLYSLVDKDKQESKGMIFVKSNSKLVKLNTSDIYFIEALKDYVVINTLDSRYTIHSTMKDIERKMPDAEFARVHRSYIVRLDKIEEIDHHNLILEDHKKQIPIGGSYKDELSRRINLV